MRYMIASSLLLLVCIGMLVRPNKAGAQASCIAKASFQKQLPPNSRRTVDIFSAMGSNLKLNAKAADVKSFGIDASGNSGPIHVASATKNCSTTQCTAVLMDSAAWEKVMVQMKCSDDTWSGWVEVDKTIN